MVKGIVRRDDTIIRLDVAIAAMNVSWAADDRQFVATGDGVDSLEQPTSTFHSRVFSLAGDPPGLSLAALLDYPETPWRQNPRQVACWGGACLSVGGALYQYLMIPNHPYLKSDGSFWPGFDWAGIKLIYSTDMGATWKNQDGSSPVDWGLWEERCEAHMLFFNEDPESSFLAPAFPAVLQMGRNYALNRDGYVYVYCGNGSADGYGNQLLLLRVPKSRIPEREAYEFFSGVTCDGKATWTRDVRRRKPVHVFPRGWVVSGEIPGQAPQNWLVSVVYNAPLGLYMMAAQGNGLAANGGWFGKPSYLGFWVAATPWGPFAQIHEERAWTPGGDSGARAFSPVISPKWISTDGKSFWLIWSDYRCLEMANEEDHPDEIFNRASRDLTDDAQLARLAAEYYRSRMPGYRLNMQRVDILGD